MGKYLGMIPPWLVMIRACFGYAYGMYSDFTDYFASLCTPTERTVQVYTAAPCFGMESLI
jgi:hypothetical protein